MAGHLLQRYCYATALETVDILFSPAVLVICIRVECPIITEKKKGGSGKQEMENCK